MVTVIRKSVSVEFLFIYLFISVDTIIVYIQNVELDLDQTT